jgi:hypothetical protein
MHTVPLQKCMLPRSTTCGAQGRQGSVHFAALDRLLRTVDQAANVTIAAADSTLRSRFMRTRLLRTDCALQVTTKRTSCHLLCHYKELRDVPHRLSAASRLPNRAQGSDCLG